MNEEKNFHLATVGGVSTIMATGAGGIGMWLLATDNRLSGAILMVCAVLMLRIALEAFGRLRKGRPEWGEYHAED